MEIAKSIQSAVVGFRLHSSLVISIFRLLLKLAYFSVFDLLPYSNERVVTNFLQQALSDPTLNDVYLLSSFKLQPKSTATVFGLYSPADNSKYFEFTVMGRMNKGELFEVCMKYCWGKTNVGSTVNGVSQML